MASNRSWYSRLWYLQHFNLFQEFTREELLPIARLAETLLELAEDLGQPCTHGFALDLVLTQQELADLIGATRQIVNATLKQWQHQGKVVLHRHRICLADRDAIRNVAASAHNPS